MKNKSTNRVVIVGAVVSGRSGDGWYGRYTGSQTVLKSMGTSGDIEVYINSPGGSVFAGFEILNAFNAATAAGRAVTIYVSAMAASIASYISSGIKGAKVIVAENAKLMFHAPWAGIVGSREQFLDTAKLLGEMEGDIARAVESRGAKVGDDWFRAGRATWMSAKEAIAMKLADEIGNPPQDLIAEVSKSPYGENYDYFDKDRNEAPKDATVKDRLSLVDQFAASTSSQGYLDMLCSERFGDGTLVEHRAQGEMFVTQPDGKSALLKYRPDPVNIVTVDWESASFQPKEESNMSTPAGTEQTPKAGAETPKVDPPKAGAETPKVDTPKAGAEPPKGDTPKAGRDELSDDAIAFARMEYQKARDAHIAKIKANAKNEFSDEELAAMPISTLAKLATIAVAETPKGDTPKAGAETPKADNSLVDPKAKKNLGEVASLPPPEL